MESQSDHDTPSATEKAVKSDSQVASNNDVIIATSPADKERGEQNAETNVIIRQETVSEGEVVVNDSVTSKMETDSDVTVATGSRAVCWTSTPHTETEAISNTLLVNKEVSQTNASGDTKMCTSRDLMEPAANQDMSVDSVVVIKQEKGLESELPQFTGMSSSSGSAGDRNTQAEVEKLCVANQNDGVEPAHPACVHVTIKQEPSVAFHDLISVADGSEEESLDEGSTELSCYTLDYRGRARKDSSSSVDSSDSDQMDSDDAREVHKAKAEKQKTATEVLKTKGELTLDNLPTLEELHIMLAEDVVMAQVGCVRSIIGPLVVVEAKPDLPALNMDTILFLEGRKVMGQVFETFGPVASPFYSVRYNCQADIERLGIEPSQTVFYAPSETQYTHYIFLEQLTSLKGSDASWEDNNEPPEKFIEFSDDEEERHCKAKKRNKNKEGSGDTEGKRRPQNKKKQDDYQRSRQGQGSASLQPTTRQNGTQNNGMPPWRNTTPNPFSQMGRPGDRGDSGQHAPPGLQQWPPPPSQMGEHSQFSSPPPRPPMFPGIDESSASWRPYSRQWNQGNMNQGHMNLGNMNPGHMNMGHMNPGNMNQGPMNRPSQWGQRNNGSPYPQQQQQPPNFATGPPGWQPFLRHGAQFGEQPTFIPGPQNNWHP